MRTAAERERMHRLLHDTEFPIVAMTDMGALADGYDRLLAAFPQLWDSLPPDPAEQARKEAEEDRECVESWRRLMALGHIAIDSHHVLALVDRMAARAKAGYDVLPPDPAEQARREAREDGKMLAAWRAGPDHYVLPVYTVARFIDRLVARAKAGYDVLPEVAHDPR